MQFVLLILIGAVVGFIATRAMRVETGVLATIAVGVLGAVIGAVVLRFVTAIASMFAGVVGAVLGALVLIWLWQRFMR